MNKFDKAYKKVVSENTNTRFKKMMIDKLPNVKTFVILTSENPMGKKFSREENKKLYKSLQTFLKDGRYKYIRVKGQYGNSEHTVAIFNLSLSEAKTVANKYEQESFIYANKKDVKEKSNNVIFEFWKKESKNKPYKKIDTVDIVNTSDADDFYTRLKSWKFNMSFTFPPDKNDRENIKEAMELIDYNPYSEYRLNEDDISKINEWIDELLNEDVTGHHTYIIRCQINGWLNKVD